MVAILQLYARGQETIRNESAHAPPKVWGPCGGRSTGPSASSKLPYDVRVNDTAYLSWSLP